MKVIKIVEMCKEVLARLEKMGYESKSNTSYEQLIFPEKNDGDDRISEQELRQLFIDVFKETYKEVDKKIYYSIETPTKAKYKFSERDKKIIDKIEVNGAGQSALLDMCVFEKDVSKYKRVLNIEFKHGNAPFKDIAKDVLKLMHEEQNGAFIFLLDNSNKGSLNNLSENRDGVLDKLSQSFSKFKEDENNWKENDEKSIQLIILSLEQKTNNKGTPFLLHRTFMKDDLSLIENFFSIREDCDNLVKVPEVDKWQKLIIDKKCN